MTCPPPEITTDPASWLVHADWLEEYGTSPAHQVTAESWRKLAAVIDHRADAFRLWFHLMAKMCIRLEAGWFGGPACCAVFRCCAGCRFVLTKKPRTYEVRIYLAELDHTIRSYWKQKQHAAYYAFNLWKLCERVSILLPPLAKE